MSPLQSSANTSGSAAMTPSMHRRRGLFLAEGMVLIVIGSTAIVVSLVVGNLAVVFLGWLFLIAGIVGLVSTFGRRRAPAFEWSLLSALVALISGATLLWNPLQSLMALPDNLVALAYVLIAFFILDGILMIVRAITLHRDLSGKREWILANGIIDLILAGIIVTDLPGTFVWAFGLLVGIDMLFGGASLIAAALEGREAAFT